MSMAFVHLGCTLLLMMPSAVELSVWMGVRGCGCPISSNIIRSSTALHAFMYNPPNSAYDAEDMTDFIISAKFGIGPLGGGSDTSLER